MACTSSAHTDVVGDACDPAYGVLQQRGTQIQNIQESLRDSLT